MRTRHSNSLITLASLIFMVGLLYWGRPVLMPLGMAVLLTFILNPAVNFLQRLHFHHTPAVVLVVLLTFSLLGVALFGIMRQFNNLALEIPRYEDNIRTKIHDLRSALRSAALDRTRQALKDLQGELTATNQTTTNEPHATGSPDPSAAATPANPPTAPALSTTPQSTTLLPDATTVITGILGPASSILVTLAFIVVLVIFMLLRRDELRDRLILLGGLEKRRLTTRILLEAGQRISRYLLTYTALNTLYGLTIAMGLFLIGLPYALLWGFFAGAVRFIPYLGPWMGATLPVGVALAVFPGWIEPVLVAGLFIMVELTTNLLLEPIFYGHSAGISEVALLVALAFWTWVWGPIGLLLATPLTICLVVLAKNIPALEPLHILIGDGPVEERCLLYYERLCTRHDRDAAEMARNFLKRNPLQRLFDELLLPALVLLTRDRQEGRVRKDAEEHVLREIQKCITTSKSTEPADEQAAPVTGQTHKPLVLGLPYSGQAAALSLSMLVPELKKSGIELHVLPVGLPWIRYSELILHHPPDAVCIGLFPPDHEAPTAECLQELQDQGYHGPVLRAQWGISPKTAGPLTLALASGFVGHRLADTVQALTQRLSLNPPAGARPTPEASADSSSKLASDLA